MESDRYIIELYCTNAHINNGNEYTYEYSISYNLRKDYPTKNNFEIISLTTNKMFWPILYTVFTTVFAFLSLIFSGIKPIIDFGWMMTFGLLTSFIITFTLLPTLLNFAPTKNMTLEKRARLQNNNFFRYRCIK